jgi:Secretin and TonB N terminus short domain
MTWLTRATLLWLVGATAAFAGDPTALMTQGKLAADTGDHAAAASAFEVVAEDTGAPASLRCEALIRLGLVRRDADDVKGSAEAFQRVWKDCRQDKEAVALLVQALGNAVPGGERWDAVWQQLSVSVDGAGSDHPTLRVAWPGAPNGLRRYTGRNISLDLKDGNLNQVFRLFADITGLNVVVHPGVRGHVTLKLKDVPWDDVLDRVLAPNGLAATLAGPVLEIARPAELPGPRRFEGQPTNLEFHDLDLREALSRAAQRGGRDLTVLSDLRGAVTIKLVGVPWDQAFDLVARLNGLTWKDDGKTIRVGLAADMR